MTSPNPDDKPSLLTRRGVLRLLALTGAGLAVGNENAQAFLNTFDSHHHPAAPSLLAKLEIPGSWLPELGPQLPGYIEYLRRVSLRTLTVRQIIEPHTKTRGSVHNSLPPRALWRNIRSTMKVVDSLASRLDLPVREVISAYRSPAYNARCPGAKSNSFHLRNNAMDVVFACPPGKVAAMARAMRAQGLFKGGVGLYDGFTHIDTRGRNADW